MAFTKLNLTRDQLSSFLTDQQQIKQFELLFQAVDTLQVIVGTDFEYQADTAFALANSALAEIASLAQSMEVEDAALSAKIQQALDAIPPLAQNTAINDAVLNAKVQLSLDAIPRLAQSLELLALAPIRNNIELEHDVVGILPYANQTQRVRSNQVLTWLSM